MVVCCLSPLKGFSYLNITKKLAKENTAFNFCCLIHSGENTCFFFKTHKPKLQKIAENPIKLIQ